MPQIQISSQSTVLPPAAAIMPSMRILQRPKSSSPAQPGNNTTPGSKSLQEREAEYKAARERIFASSGGGENGSSSREGSPAPKRGIIIRGRGGGGGNGARRGSLGGSGDGIVGSGAVREPMGPQEGTRGFGSRGRRGRGSTSDKQV